MENCRGSCHSYQMVNLINMALPKQVRYIQTLHRSTCIANVVYNDTNDIRHPSCNLHPTPCCILIQPENVTFMALYANKCICTVNVVFK